MRTDPVPFGLARELGHFGIAPLVPFPEPGNGVIGLTEGGMEPRDVDA